jgi:nucleotide-binding universal stress UspA family protein
MTEKVRVLIGYDGSAGADSALEELKRAGFPRETEALVLCAADVLLPAGPATDFPKQKIVSIEKARQRAEEAVTEAGRLAETAGKKLKTAFPSWTIHNEFCADSPAWAIVKKAEEWKSTLIVVGAHGHSVVGRFLGSVSQMVLTQAPCSVRVGRARSHSENDKVRVVLGIDGSPDCEAAVQAAAARSWPPNTEFLLISVIDPKMSSLIADLAPPVMRLFLEQADDERALIGRMLESYATKLREGGAVATCLVKEGDPKRVIVEEAETRQADCIFVGARGLTHLKRFFLGGVSTAVAARAHCSVEVARG